MQNFTTKIVELMKEEKLFAWQGGPIVLTQVPCIFVILVFSVESEVWLSGLTHKFMQIENEYGNMEKPKKGQSYIQWTTKMALSLNTGLPWAMC